MRLAFFAILRPGDFQLAQDWERGHARTDGKLLWVAQQARRTGADPRVWEKLHSWALAEIASAWRKKAGAVARSYLCTFYEWVRYRRLARTSWVPGMRRHER